MDWVEFDATVEPIGDRRAELHAAHICATFANINRDKKKRKEPFLPSDFMLFKEEGMGAPAPVVAKDEEKKGAKISADVLTGLMVMADITAAQEKGTH